MKRRSVDGDVWLTLDAFRSFAPFDDTSPRYGDLVQIADVTDTSPINKDALLIEHDRIPDGGRSGIFEPESAEVELPLANAMYQLDA